MKRHRQNLPILESIPVIDIGNEGIGVAKKDELVMFVKGAVPGDIVDVQLTLKKKNFAEGKVVRIVSSSPDRIEPVCEHFGICGGCKWQNLSYSAQLTYKQKQVFDSFTRIAKVEIPEMKEIAGSAKQYYYRNKLEFTFSNKRWLTTEEMAEEKEGKVMDALGFHIPKMFDKILDIKHCYLQEEPSNSIRTAIRDYALKNKLSFFDLRSQEGLLRNVIIRTSNTKGVMVIMIFHADEKESVKGLMEHLKTGFPQITSLQYVINPKKNDTISDLEVIPYSGDDFITEEMEGLKFKVSAKSFYQTNSEQAFELYTIARDMAGLTGSETVYDLYTGTGTIANFVAKQSKKVIGIEYIDSAIADAKENSKLNNISNTVFYAGDMKDILNAAFMEANGKPDVIITDPPRVGMHADVVKVILETAPEKVVYVSCNPATQARDVALMNSLYRVEKIQPVDMFPQTHHVENVVLLRRRD
jgi:23S rRNA (uracil1939-C5)-methyltransferase